MYVTWQGSKELGKYAPHLLDDHKENFHALPPHGVGQPDHDRPQDDDRETYVDHLRMVSQKGNESLNLSLNIEQPEGENEERKVRDD